jgi:hypothetical protein
VLTPTDQKLYDRVTKEVNTRYSKPPAYRSTAVIKEYKARGGTFRGKRETGDLYVWQKERWKSVAPPEQHPVYRPTRRVSKDTPLTPSEIDQHNLQGQVALKQVYKGGKNLPPFKGVGAGLKANPDLLKYASPERLEEVLRWSDPTAALKRAKQVGYDPSTIFTSPRVDKKYLVVTPEGKKVHFGQVGYADFSKRKDLTRRQRFVTRNAKWKDAPAYTPSHLSYWITW